MALPYRELIRLHFCLHSQAHANQQSLLFHSAYKGILLHASNQHVFQVNYLMM